MSLISPVILRIDLEQIPTEAFSSKIFQDECLNEHNKSPKKSEHGNIPKFGKTLTSSLLQHENEANTGSALIFALTSTKSDKFRMNNTRDESEHQDKQCSFRNCHNNDRNSENTLIFLVCMTCLRYGHKVFFT